MSHKNLLGAAWVQRGCSVGVLLAARAHKGFQNSSPRLPSGPSDHRIWISLFFTSVKTRTKCNKVEASVSGHPREAEKVSATGAGRLRECVNTEFV